MEFSPYYYSFIFFIGGSVSFITSWFAFRQNTVRERYLGFVMISAGLWSFLSGTSLLTGNIEYKFNLAVVYVITAQLIPILMLGFSLRLINDIDEKILKAVNWIFVYPALTFLLTSTNNRHNLIWTGYYASPIGQGVIETTVSRLYDLSILYPSYLIATIDLLILLYAAFQPKPQMPRKTMILILLSIAVPWISNVVYWVFDFRMFPGIEPTPLFFIASGVLVAFALTENLIFDLNQKYMENSLAISRLRMEQNQRMRLEADLAKSQILSTENLKNHSRDLQGFYDLIVIGEQAKSEAEIIQQSIVKIKKVINCDLILYYNLQQNGKFRLKSFTGTSAKEAPKIILDKEEWLPKVGELRIDQDLRSIDNIDAFFSSGIFDYALTQYVIAEKQPKALVIALRSTSNVFYTENDITLYSAMVNGVGVIIENEVIREQIIEEATNEERLRIARNMHDSIAQLLNGMLLTIDTILTTGKDTPSIKFSLIKMKDSLAQGIREMRLFLYESREKSNESFDFPTLIASRTQYVEAHSGMNVVLDLKQTKKFPRSWHTHLYMITNESLNNALLHSKAKQVEIVFQQQEEVFHLQIIDDGKGMNLEEISNSGYGLKNIEERCRLMGAELQILSNKPQGTIIDVTIPEKLQGEKYGQN